MESQTLWTVRSDSSTPVSARTWHASVEVRSVYLGFGGQKVLEDLSFDLEPGLTILRGENGTGKSVLLNILSGYLQPDRGSATLKLGGSSIDVTRTSPEALARLGVGRLWQDIRLFPTMTVLENVMVATPRLVGEHPLTGLLSGPKLRHQERIAEELALQNLALLGMEGRSQSSCDRLSVGQMKRVALARLHQMEASILLLDEPFAGLDSESTITLARDLDRLRSGGKTILVVEHRLNGLSEIADRIWTLEDGSIANEGGTRG